MSGTARQSNNQTNMKTNETKMTTKPNETVRDFAAEAATAGFVRRFIGALTAEEIKAALVAASAAGESWPSPDWLRAASPAAMRGVADGWSTWDEPAPEGAIELLSGEEQRQWCGNRWLLFPA